MVLRAVFGDVLDALVPPRCPGCGRRGEVVCARCSAALVPAPHDPPPPPVEWWTACFAYTGVARELVARAKYRNERRFIGLVARDLAHAVGAAPAPVDLVTWAPASRARVRAQGVDHGELLARAVAPAIDAPVAACLLRAPGRAQTGLGARERRLGPRLDAVRPVEAATVLVVDDVATTGGTLGAAGRALRQAGARAVFAATIARTPAPGVPFEVSAYTPAHPGGTEHRTR